MAFRPTRKPSAQRPQDVPAVRARAVVGENPALPVAGQAASSSELVDGPAQRLLQELETVLRDEPGLDSDMRQMLQAQFSEALEMAERDSQAAAVPPRGEWLDAIDALKQSGLLAEGEVNDLIRQIDGALAPLERRESKLAIEFSRRIQEQGQESAMAWFRQARAAEEDASADEADAPPSGSVPAAGSEVIQSRSRRLRGPPVRR